MSAFECLADMVAADGDSPGSGRFVSAFSAKRSSSEMKWRSGSHSLRAITGHYSEKLDVEPACNKIEERGWARAC